jgi:hypothetical protein
MVQSLWTAKMVKVNTLFSQETKFKKNRVLYLGKYKIYPNLF